LHDDGILPSTGGSHWTAPGRPPMGFVVLVSLLAVGLSACTHGSGGRPATSDFAAIHLSPTHIPATAL